MKAAQTLIAWQPIDWTQLPNRAPPGSIAVGPLLDMDDLDWVRPYECNGGASYAARRTMSGIKQQMLVLRDWHMIVYLYGLHPYVAHRAFLLIDEYQTIMKDIGVGPAPGEPGHDPDLMWNSSKWHPALDIKMLGKGTHFWPCVKED